MPRNHAHHTAFTNGFYVDEGRDFAVRLLLGYCASGGADAGEVLATIANCPKNTTSTGPTRGWPLAAASSRPETPAARRGTASAPRRPTCARRTTFPGLRRARRLRRRRAAHARSLPSTARPSRKFLDHGDFTAQRLEIPYEDTTLPGWYLTPQNRAYRCDPGDDQQGATARCRHCGAPRRSGRCAAATASSSTTVPASSPCCSSAVSDSARLGGGVAAGHRPRAEAARRRRCQARALRHQSGRLLGPALTFAFEHRYAARSPIPVSSRCAPRQLKFFPKPLIDALDKGPGRLFNREISLGMKFSPPPGACGTGGRGHIRTGASTTRCKRSSLHDHPAIAEQIVTPLLITDPDHEQFWPGQSQALAAMCRDGIATLARFTTAGGGLALPTDGTR